MDKETYEKELKQRQEEHLKNVNQNRNNFINNNWSPCLHDSCNECCGTGIKLNGSSCIHFISCPCPKCSVH